MLEVVTSLLYLLIVRQLMVESIKKQTHKRIEENKKYRTN